ncbi:MAG TPA: lysylphosphatidylglycerol synthase transmembrane domain-containing protein [Pseudolabrys sp.]|nr:lysylphosphatidylglycerol synthase transmembrane domain-containing protein [Pseudolabrys sp.]
MRRVLSLVVKAAISGLLLYFALNLVNIGTVADRLTHTNPVWLGLGLLLLLIQVFLLALRWGRIVTACGAELPLGGLFRLSIIAIFFNQTLPSSVGGDAMRIWLVGKQTNWRIAAYSVFLDRVVGVVALAAIVVICLPWSLNLVRNPVGRGALLVIGFGALAAGVIFIALAWDKLRFLQRWSLTRHLVATAGIAIAILRSPRDLLSIAVLSALIHLLSAAAAWCAAQSVGADLSLANSLFLVLPVILISIVPISIAGWGVREGAMVAAFAYAGLPESDGLIVSLLFGAGFLVLGMVGGLVWIFDTEDRTPRTVPVPGGGA